jgi:hypothetical protein
MAGQRTRLITACLNRNANDFDSIYPIAVTESFLSRIYASATIPQSKQIELQFSEAIKIDDLGNRANNGRTATQNSQTKTDSTEQ